VIPYGLCSTIGGMSNPSPPKKSALNIEVPTELKERLVAYADDRGLSQTASATILLGDALTQAGYPRASR
jgi:hypothetical protein